MNLCTRHISFNFLPCWLYSVFGYSVFGEEDRCLHVALRVVAFPEMLTKSVITRATTATRAGCFQRGMGQTTPFSGHDRRPTAQHTPAEHRGAHWKQNLRHWV